MPAAPRATSTNVVLVHGAFVDGSGWEAVYRSLRCIAQGSREFRVTESSSTAPLWRKLKDTTETR
jgi:hypothetical protein